MKKLFIVEDQEDIRFIYSRTIARRFPDIAIVGETATGEEALLAIPKAKPDLVIVDISLPGMDGIELVRRLHKEDPQLRILVMTGYERELLEGAATEAGAAGIIEKGNLSSMIQRISEILNLELHRKPERARS